MPTPSHTTLHQDSTTIFDDAGAAKFRIVSSITYVKPGDLPLAAGATVSEVFVHAIVDADDPKQDTFLRVANIHDLTKITRGRDNAILASETTYLTLSFTVEFDDVTTAASAKEVVQIRVDSLIADWITYTTAFLVPVDFPMPAPESTLVTAAKAAFAQAQSDSAAAEAALATANAESAEAQAEAARASDTYVAALTDSNTCTQTSATASSMKAAEDAFRAAMNTFKTAEGSFQASSETFKDQAVTAEAANPNPTFSGQITTYSGLLTTNAANLTNAAAALTAELQNGKSLIDLLVSNIASECATKAAAVVSTATAKSTADAAVATTQTAQSQAQATATAAAAAEAAALAAVLAVCADFDPNA